LVKEATEMTIQVDISPETEAWLASQAAARSMDISGYVAALLERAKHPDAESPQQRSAISKSKRASGQVSLAQLFAESPFRGLNLDFDADRDTCRNFLL
jgi:hypothetical protein